MATKIVYRVVSGILALCVIPISLFVPMIRIVGSFSLMDSYVGENVSLYDIYDLFLKPDSTFGNVGEGFKLNDVIRGTLPPLIASGVCFALLIVLSLVILGFAAFSNKKLVILCLSASAVVVTIVMFATFGSFARPFTDGTITVSDLGVMGEGIISTLLSSLVSLKVLQLTSAAFLMVIAFIVIFLWSVAFFVTEIGEKKR